MRLADVGGQRVIQTVAQEQFGSAHIQPDQAKNKQVALILGQHVIVLSQLQKLA